MRALEAWLGSSRLRGALFIALGALACSKAATEQTTATPDAKAVHHQPSSRANSTGDDATRLVGVWELVRYDNIPQGDTPPAGMVNVAYAFLPDGRLEHFVPGARGNEPARGGKPTDRFTPYSLKGDHLEGWLGLTNDLDETTTVAFSSDGSAFEAIFRDGSIAAFERLTTDPSKAGAVQARCIPYTIAGGSYDRQLVAEIKNRMAQAAAPGELQRVIGTWFNAPLGGVGKAGTFEFRADGNYLRTDWVRGLAEQHHGRYELHNGVLTINNLEGDCPQTLIAVYDDRIELGASSKGKATLWRSEADVVGSPTESAGDYGFGFFNESSDQLEDAVLEEPRMPRTTVRPSSSGGFIMLRAILPPVLRASWRRNGAQKSGRVDLAGALRKDAKVRLITVVISASDQLSLRLEYEGDGAQSPEDSDREDEARAGAARFRAALKAGDDRAALAELAQLKSRHAAKSGLAVQPVWLAAVHGRLGVLKATLAAGGDANETDASGFSALAGAANLGRLDLVQILVKAGARVNTERAPPLMEGIHEGRTDVVRYLLKHGADPNVAFGGEFALSAAIGSKNIEVTRMLLSAGADANRPYIGGSLVSYAQRMKAPAELVALLAAAAKTSGTR